MDNKKLTKHTKFQDLVKQDESSKNSMESQEKASKLLIILKLLQNLKKEYL